MTALRVPMLRDTDQDTTDLHKCLALLHAHAQAGDGRGGGGGAGTDAARPNEAGWSSVRESVPCDAAIDDGGVAAVAMPAAPQSNGPSVTLPLLRPLRGPAAALHVVVLGAFGGRLDHTVQNCAALAAWAPRFGAMVLMDDQCTATLLPPGAWCGVVRSWMKHTRRLSPRPARRTPV